MEKQIYGFSELGLAHIEQVGGKNASLGELINHLTRAGVNVPQGFATSAQAYRDFLRDNQLDTYINGLLSSLQVDDIQALVSVGHQIRQAILSAEFSGHFVEAITQAYQRLVADYGVEASFAVRSSATAEDLPDASFAGQQETFLNIRGISQILLAIKQVFASLFTDRAIAYRDHQGFAHSHVALSVGVQRMVRSDQGTSGVMFTLDTESGFADVVLITAAYGLGESVVQGAVNPDEFYVYKPNVVAQRPALIRRNLGSKMTKLVFDAQASYQHSVVTVDVEQADQQRFCLTDADIEQLAQHALLIEAHYGQPMDIEWAKDGVDQQLYILQARPETVKSQQQTLAITRYQLAERSTVLTSGRSVGDAIGKGRAKIIANLQQMHEIGPDDVLVTDMTDPDWEPIMKRAAAIVTNRGGRTCHAAIIARELGIPAVVGCGDATKTIMPDSPITVSCAEGDTGYVYEGALDFTIQRANLSEMPSLPLKIMVNIGNPERAFAVQRLPNDGVGLARLEFIINQMIGIHPQAALDYPHLAAPLRDAIAQRCAGYASPTAYYCARLQEGIATIAAAFYPKPVIVRLSDFKSNEYAHLLGGTQYEPQEANPMLGFRGACRYLSEQFGACFALECQALRYVRETQGLSNIAIMVPFVRTPQEARAVIELLAQHGLQSGKHDLKIYMMCELPSNALLADEFLQYFDGFSIGSNDLTQLTLGLDRDSGLVAKHFDERDPAIKQLLHKAISSCKRAGKYVGLCGQGPSDHPDFALWLMEQGIDSLSLNPDSVLSTWLMLAGQSK